VLNFKSDYNSVLNKSGSGGRIQLKASLTSDLESIKKNFKLYGLEVEMHQESEAKPKL
jgi:hypothetical protein